MAIPLFQAVSERYRGQRLPDSQTLRNVLEREFHVEHARVQQAERMLLDSARDAHLLKHQGDGTYLAVSDGANGAFDDTGSMGSHSLDAAQSSVTLAMQLHREPYRRLRSTPSRSPWKKLGSWT